MAGPITDDARWFQTPPSSPDLHRNPTPPSLRTDDLGMIVDDPGHKPSTRAASPVARQPAKRTPKLRRHVSHHFKQEAATIATPPKTPQKPRIPPELNVEDWSSDSSLSEARSDLSDPFTPEKLPRKAKKARQPVRSPYFEHNKRPQFRSCLPCPPVSDLEFGLMQERLAHDPFRLLIATIFLNRTRGTQAMPVLKVLLDKYPTVEDLAAAKVEDVTSIIQKLGFQNQRARKCVQVAKSWLSDPPTKGRRYAKRHYPVKGDGRDIAKGEVLADDDERVAWEIAHLPGLGSYAHDSWRMFCRDKLRGLSDSWNGEGAPEGFEPEWKRVIPTDKELRAYLSWMWLKEGWRWNKTTGERTKADPLLLGQMRDGGIILEKMDLDYLQFSNDKQVNKAVQDMIETPAGSVPDTVLP